MNISTQKHWTINQLKENGFVSRNKALEQGITRLGAIINLLNNEGGQISGKYHKTGYGKDYIYTLNAERPKSKYELFHEKMQNV